MRLLPAVLYLSAATSALLLGTVALTLGLAIFIWVLSFSGKAPPYLRYFFFVVVVLFSAGLDGIDFIASRISLSKEFCCCLSGGNFFTELLVGLLACTSQSSLFLRTIR